MSNAHNSNSLQERISPTNSSVDYEGAIEDRNVSGQQNTSSVNIILEKNHILEALGQLGDFEDPAVHLDYSYNQLIREMQNKYTFLEFIRKQNEEIKQLKIDKLRKSRVDLLYTTTNLSSDSLRQMIEDRQQELLELLNQQIEDLESFEDEMRNLASKFPIDSRNSGTESLREQVERLQTNIAKKITDLRKYKEGISKNFENKTLEESIGFINYLNEKLTKSVEQMTREVTRVRSKVSDINFEKDTS